MFNLFSCQGIKYRFGTFRFGASSHTSYPRDVHSLSYSVRVWHKNYVVGFRKTSLRSSHIDANVFALQVHESPVRSIQMLKGAFCDGMRSRETSKISGQDMRPGSCVWHHRQKEYFISSWRAICPDICKKKKKDISTTCMSGEREGREERMDGWTEEEEVRGEVVLLNLHNPPDSRGGQGGPSVVVRTTLDLATESQWSDRPSCCCVADKIWQWQRGCGDRAVELVWTAVCLANTVIHTRTGGEDIN